MKEVLENLNESRRVLFAHGRSMARSPLKKQVFPRTRIYCLQALQFLLYVASSLKQSSRSFPFHDELWKNVKLPYWKSTVWGASSHIVDFSSNFSCDNWIYCKYPLKGYCSDPNVVKISMKVHPLYLKHQKRWLAFKLVGSRPFSPVCKRANIETLSTFYMKHVAGASYGHVTP